MQKNELEKFCDAWLQSWTGNQPEDLLCYYAEDAYYQDPAQPHGLRGQQALKKYFTKLLAKNPDWIWTRQELHPITNGFVLKWQAEIPILEADLLIEGLDLVELDENKITRNEVYFDARLLSSAKRK